MAAPVIRIDAIKYARHERTAVNNFAKPVDDHDLPMPLDYFVWAIHRTEGPPVIVDTGFGEDAAAARGRTLTRSVNDGLRAAAAFSPNPVSTITGGWSSRWIAHTK